MNCRKSNHRLSCIIFIIILPCVILLIGCFPAVKPAGPSGACLPPGVFFEKIDARDALKGTMTALADLDIRTMGKRYPGRMAVMVKGPGFLRMEAIPPIGPPNFMLSIKNGRLKVFLPEKGEFYVGEASRHLSRFIPILIDTRDVVSLLLGTYPPLQEGDCAVPEAVEGGQRQVDIRSKGGAVRMSIWMKWPEQTLLRLKTYDSSEREDYSVVFSDYGMTQQVPMPETLVIRRNGWGGLKQTITVRYTDLEFREGRDDGAFELDVPPGVTPIQLQD